MQEVTEIFIHCQAKIIGSLIFRFRCILCCIHEVQRAYRENYSPEIKILATGNILAVGRLVKLYKLLTYDMV